VDLRPLRSRALLLAPAEKIADIQNDLKDMRELLDPSLVGDLTPWKLMALAQILDRARTQGEAVQTTGAVSAGGRKFFGQLAAIAKSAAASLDDPDAYENPWRWR